MDRIPPSRIQNVRLILHHHRKKKNESTRPILWSPNSKVPNNPRTPSFQQQDERDQGKGGRNKEFQFLFFIFPKASFVCLPAWDRLPGLGSDDPRSSNLSRHGTKTTLSLYVLNSQKSSSVSSSPPPPPPAFRIMIMVSCLVKKKQCQILHVY